MAILILGLVIFLGTHSIRIFAENWRTKQRRRYGGKVWKAAYSMAAILGFVLIVWGFGMARHTAVFLWTPPIAMRHVAALLMVVSLVLITAAYVPGNSIKSRLHHPMLLGVQLWAFAHLLANGSLPDVILFGSFLVWAVLCFRVARQRDKDAMTPYPAGTATATAFTVLLGLVVWALFAFWLHRLLIGVPLF